MPEIIIDEITSIGNNFFAFKYKGDFITQPPFTLKQRTVVDNSSYHFDRDDLKKINKQIEDIFPYYLCSQYKLTGIKLNSYMALMRYRFFQHILNGDMPTIMSLVTSKNIECKIVWDKSAKEYVQPQLKFD